MRFPPVEPLHIPTVPSWLIGPDLHAPNAKLAQAPLRRHQLRKAPMHLLRRTVKTTAVAAALALTAGIATTTPAHSAELNMENLRKVVANADSISCPDLKKQLDKTGRVNANTTRADLVKMANAELASKPLLRAAAGPTINKVANRALACGLVKANKASTPAKPAPAPAPGNRTPSVPAKPSKNAGNTTSKTRDQAKNFRSQVSSLSSMSSR